MRVTRALRLAVEAANRSHCAKSKRGVILWDASGQHITGWNHQPAGFTCDGSDECRRACNKLCLHAEEHAILRVLGSASFRRFDLAQMLHVKVVDGQAVPSGAPSCWQCSRLVAAVGIRGFWLLHEDGLWSYTAEDFHRQTLRNRNLPVIHDDIRKEAP